MSQQAPGTPDVSRSIEVRAGIDEAFAVFAGHPIDWLPPAHTFLAEVATMTIDPRVGGQFIEHGSNGACAIRGTVLDWEPPRRIVFTWRIGADWRPIDNDEHASHVEIRFEAEAADRTRVVLTHTHLDHHGGAAGSIHAALDRPGPSETLSRYAHAVTAHTGTGHTGTGHEGTGQHA